MKPRHGRRGGPALMLIALCVSSCGQEGAGPKVPPYVGQEVADSNPTVDPPCRAGWYYVEEFEPVIRSCSRNVRRDGQIVRVEYDSSMFKTP